MSQAIVHRDQPALEPAIIPPVDDLTNRVQLTYEYPIACSNFSDVYKGVILPDHAASPAGEECKVAVKLLRAITAAGELDFSRAKKRLNREVGILLTLDHPNIVRFLGISYMAGDRPCVVMEWHADGDAHKYAIRKGRPKSEIIILMSGVAKGLRYLHGRTPPIIHGDIKGKNILVSGKGEAVLTDFGLSKVLDESIGTTGNTTSTQNKAGTVRWQAPELVHDQDSELPGSLSAVTVGLGLSQASDVWAFGCTAYELLTGKLPYALRTNDWSVPKDILGGTPPFSDEDVGRYGVGELQDALKACWTLRAEDRPSATELCIILEPGN